MSELHGIDFKYYAWENNYVDKTITHPDASPEYGGISHLSSSDQKYITEERWVPDFDSASPTSSIRLYRAHQDTIVEISEIMAILKDATRNFKINKA